METKTLGECLNEYHGGLFRRMIRSEPRYADLTALHDELVKKGITKIEDSEDVDPKHIDKIPENAYMQRLITILLSKNDKSGTKESSKLCLKIAAKLGGYDALSNYNQIKLLNEKTLDSASARQLNKKTIEMMLAYPQEAKFLTKIWVEAKTDQLKQLISIEYLSQLAKSLHSVDPVRFDDVRILLENTHLTSEPNFIESVALINRLHAINYPVTEALVSKIIALPLKEDLEKLLDLVAQKHPQINLEQIDAVLDTKNPSLLFDIISERPKLTAEYVQSLITTFTQTTTPTELVNPITRLFMKHHWSMDKYLPLICSLPGSASPTELLALLERLATSFELLRRDQRNCVELVLSRFLKNSEHAAEITYAVECLIKANQMNQDCLTMVLEKPEIAVKRANGIKNVGQDKVKPEYIELIKKAEEDAEGVGEFCQQHMKVNYRNKDFLNKIGEQPNLALNTAKILEKLITHNRHHYQPFINYLIEHIKDVKKILPAITHLSDNLTKDNLKALTQCGVNDLLKKARELTGTVVEETSINPGRSRHGFTNKKQSGDTIATTTSELALATATLS